MTEVKHYDCLGENKLPWFYDLERGVDNNVRTYYYVQDDNEHVATLSGSVVIFADWGFHSSNERIQRLVDNYFQDLLEENKIVLLW